VEYSYCCAFWYLLYWTSEACSKRTYWSLNNNEIWFEKIWLVSELKRNWDNLKGLFVNGGSLEDFLKKRTPRDVYLNVEIVFPDANANPQISHFLDQNFGLNDVNLQRLLHEWKIPFMPKCHISSYWISNRILPKEDIITPLPQSDTRLIFVGDAFHESLFTKGNGLMVHMAEVLGVDIQAHGLFFNNVISDRFDPPKVGYWLNEAMEEGKTYVQSSKDFFGLYS